MQLRKSATPKPLPKSDLDSEASEEEDLDEDYKGNTPASAKNKKTVEAQNGVQSENKQKLKKKKSNKDDKDTENQKEPDKEEGDKEKDFNALKSPKIKKQKGKGKVPVENKTAPQGDASGLSLYAIISSHPESIGAAVSDWARRYEEDNIAGTLELINLVVQVSGCKGTISRQEFEAGEVEKTLERLTDTFPEDFGDYPILEKDKPSKALKKNYLDLWTKLFIQASTGVLYDKSFLEPITTWLAALSSSPVRSFRHTATLGGLRMINAAVDVAKDLKTTEETSSRQARAETGKAASQKGKGEQAVSEKKASQMQKKAEQIAGQVKAIEEGVVELFNAIFVHRYRDIVPEIRAACIAALGQWIEAYPSFFLFDRYLKYIGWLLNDKDPEVRLAAVESLVELYSGEEYQAGLSLFTTRFKSRFVELVRDVEPIVAATAIKLTIKLLESNTLDPVDVSNISLLILDEEAEIRSAAAEFLIKSILKYAAGATSSTKKAKVAVDPTVELRALLSFLARNVKTRQQVLRIVLTLWDKSSVLKQVDVMTNMLLSDESDSLADAEHSQLVRLICSCAHAAEIATSQIKSKPENNAFTLRRNPTKKEKELSQQVLNDLTEHLMEQLPKLIAKFQSDESKLEDLIELPQRFVLSMYTTHRRQKAFTDTVKEVCAAVQRHVRLPILQTCAATLRHFTMENHSLQSQAQERVAQLSQTLQDRLVKALEQVTAEPEATQDEKVIVNLTAVLRRLTAVHFKMDLSHLDGIFPALISFLNASLSFDELTDDEGICLALDLALVHIAWKVQSIDTEQPDDSDVETIVQLRDDFIPVLGKLLSSAPIPAVKAKAFEKLHDVLVGMFSPKLVGTSMSALAFSPPLELREQIVEYFEKEMAVEDESESAVARKVKLVAALGAEGVSTSIPLALVGPAILSNYIRQPKLVQDAVRETYKRLRQATTEADWRMELEAVKKIYLREEEVERGIGAEVAKELAQRLALTHGVGAARGRANAPALLKAGIDFALRAKPPKIDFLDALIPYANRLNPKEASEVAAHVDAEMIVIEGESPQDDDVKESVREFVAILSGVAKGEKTPNTLKKSKGRLDKALAEEDEAEKSANTAGPSRRGRRRQPAKPKDEEEEEEEEVEEESTPLVPHRTRRGSENTAAATAKPTEGVAVLNGGKGKGKEKEKEKGKKDSAAEAEAPQEEEKTRRPTRKRGMQGAESSQSQDHSLASEEFAPRVPQRHSARVKLSSLLSQEEMQDESTDDERPAAVKRSQQPSSAAKRGPAVPASAPVSATPSQASVTSPEPASRKRKASAGPSQSLSQPSRSDATSGEETQDEQLSLRSSTRLSAKKPSSSASHSQDDAGTVKRTRR